MYKLADEGPKIFLINLTIDMLYLNKYILLTKTI